MSLLVQSSTDTARQVLSTDSLINLEPKFNCILHPSFVPGSTLQRTQPVGDEKLRKKCNSFRGTEDALLCSGRDTFKWISVTSTALSQLCVCLKKHGARRDIKDMRPSGMIWHQRSSDWLSRLLWPQEKTVDRRVVTLISFWVHTGLDIMHWSSEL